MSLGEQLKKARKEKGLTQKQLAERLSLSEITIRQYEANKREPRIEQQLRICEILNISLSELVNAAEMIANAEKTLDDFGKEISESIARQNEAKKNTLISQYGKLNSSGKDEAIKRVEELTEIRKYTEKEEDSF